MSREQEQPVEQERKACSCAHFAGSNVELGFFFFFYARGLVGLALVGWGAVRLLRSLMVWFFLPQMEAFLFLFFFFCCAQEIPASQAPFNRTRIHWQHEAPRSLSHEPPPKKRSWQQQHDKCWKNSKMTHPIVRISSPITQVVSGRLLAASDRLHRIKTLQVSVMIRCVQKSLLWTEEFPKPKTCSIFHRVSAVESEEVLTLMNDLDCFFNLPIRTERRALSLGSFVKIKKKGKKGHRAAQVSFMKNTVFLMS